MKNNYSVDKNNCLVIKRKSKKYIAQGNFTVSKNNRLSYWLNETSHWRKKLCLPKRIDFIGNWHLNPNYDLEFVLVKTKEQYANERLRLRGEILNVNQDFLAFEIITKDRRGQTHIHILKIDGAWQADGLNRISFLVEKKENPDVLLFKGLWQINKNQQIVYNYEKTYLKRKTKVRKTLIFEGYWQINEKNKLTYILEGAEKSILNFRAQLESSTIYPKEGEIRYRLGIGHQPKMRIISLYGVFNFSRKGGISFMIDYGRKIKEIKFSANVYFSKENELILSLLGKDKTPLGINLVFQHKFLKDKDAYWFLRLKKLAQESRAETGISIPF